jgi:membrane-bound lytic murein transglycosylase A
MRPGRSGGARLRRALALLLVAALQGCENQETTVPEITAAHLRVAGYSELQGWQDDDLAAVLPAWQITCDALRRRSSESGPGGTVAGWLEACRHLPPADSSRTAIHRYFEAWFIPHAVSDSGVEQGLFTGYYEPELTGTRRRTEQYAIPLYRRPDDLVEIDGETRPYYTRAEIDAGRLAGRGLELLWLADPVDAFFLHVQGSGRVRVEEEGIVRIGYAGNNGHPYTAIGRILVERGEMIKENTTLQTIRHWLHTHPDEATALMQMNARYIFFRELEGGGPVGTLGVALTPGRSLAVDAEYIPLGAPVWLDTTYPAGTPKAGQPLRRLMVAQDTGAAIRGPVRGDVYWGSGETAARYAGPMRQQGRFFVLLPKAVAKRLGALR